MSRINWLEVLFWIIILLLLAMVLTRIFGHSATDVQIYLAFISGLLVVMTQIVKMNREIGEIKIQMKNSFRKVRDDIEKLKRLTQ